MKTSARPTIAVLVTAVAALLLTGCGGDASTPSASPTTASPTAAATPSVSASALPTTEPAVSFAANIPASCDALASEATRAETVGGFNLQSNGEGFVRPGPDGATLALGCDWFAGDTTGVLLLISTATPDAVAAAAGALPAQGYACQVSDDFGADYCVLPGEGENDEQTVVARDDVWIYLSTGNVNARAFLSEIASQIFG